MKKEKIKIPENQKIVLENAERLKGMKRTELFNFFKNEIPHPKSNAGQSFTYYKKYLLAIGIDYEKLQIKILNQNETTN